MILISGREIENLDGYSTKSIEGKIIKRLSASRETYDYDSADQLKFELTLRANIVSAARELNKSNMKFKVFKEASCNEDYWILTKKGGFLLRDNVKPYDAINDIFTNGAQYGTECSTAIIIVFYRAVAKVYPKELFDTTFENLHLFSWKYIDSDLDVNTFENLEDYLPGDCRYFDNPDFNPDKPEWQGENTIDLGDGIYYGHGIGIGKTDQIIQSLNRHRKEDASTPASILDTADRPNYKHLANIYAEYMARNMGRYCKECWKYFGNWLVPNY